MENIMDYSKQKKNLFLGIFGCLLFVIGDYLYAAVGPEQSTDTVGLMVRVAYLDIAAWRMAASILCGVLGAALYYVGFRQMDKLLKQRLLGAETAEMDQRLPHCLHDGNCLLGLCPCHVYEHCPRIQVYL